MYFYKYYVKFSILPICNFISKNLRKQTSVFTLNNLYHMYILRHSQRKSLIKEMLLMIKKIKVLGLGSLECFLNDKSISIRVRKCKGMGS